MSDWIDNLLKDRFQEDSVLSQNITWERFETMYNKRNRHRIVRRSFFIIGAAAVVIALLIVPFNHPADNPSITAMNSEAYEISTKEIMQSVQERELVRQFNSSLVESFIKQQDDSIDRVSNFLPEDEGEDVEEDQVIDIIEEREKEGIIIPTSVIIDNKEGVNKTRQRIRISPYFKSSEGKIMYQGDFKFNYKLLDQISTFYPATFGSGSKEKMNSLHHIPINFGIETSYSISQKLAVSTGVELSYYYSNYNSQDITFNQNAFYLGIPLRLDWMLWQSSSMSTWIGGGGKVDRLVYGKFGTDRIKDNTLNWSIIGNLGIQYDLSKNVGVFIAPEVSYYFKRDNPILQTYRTENPLVFTVGAGLRFNF